MSAEQPQSESDALTTGDVKPRVASLRILAIGGFFAVWALVIEARLINLQVWRHEDWQVRAARQQASSVPIPAMRGEILDRHQRPVASSVKADSVYGVPVEISDPGSVAREVCAVLGDCTPEGVAGLQEKLGLQNRRDFVWIRRQLEAEMAQRLAGLKLDGIGFLQEETRRYPNMDLAAHLVGYVGVDNEGLAGIESTYDHLLKGQPGTALITTDGQRRASSRIEKPSTRGGDLELTIDVSLQYLVQRELLAAVERDHNATGSVVVLDPSSGDILAIASAPTFDLNEFRTVSEAARRNRAVLELYPADALLHAIRARLLSPLSIEVSAELVRLLGFGQKLSDDFTDQSAGEIRVREGRIEGIRATPLQIAVALVPLANRGKVLVPRIVRAVVSDGVRRDLPRRPPIATLSVTTSQTFTEAWSTVGDLRQRGYTMASDIRNTRTSFNSNYAGVCGGYVVDMGRSLVVLVALEGTTTFSAANSLFRRVSEAALVQFDTHIN